VLRHGRGAFIMVDYAKKTVAELQEILKSRSLPHTGKKADLIARLNEADTVADQAGMHQSLFQTPMVLTYALRSDYV
jgi:hypothetical protein